MIQVFKSHHYIQRAQQRGIGIDIKTLNDKLIAKDFVKDDRKKDEYRMYINGAIIVLRKLGGDSYKLMTVFRRGDDIYDR